MSLVVDIRKRFKGFSLAVQFESEGVPLGILGASGSGKSMTLKCIAGIETPDEGHIELNGRILFDSAKKINIKPQKRNIGYLFQNYALFPNMTVEQNISCALADKMDGRKGNPERKKRVAELLSRFELSGFEAHYPAQLSGGQQQRAALARIFAYEPEALLLDEPFSALDAHLREALQLEMCELLRQYDGDVVMVTHSRDEVYKLCEDLLILDGGSVVEYGKTRALFAKPKHLLAAKITGCKNFSKAEKCGEREVFASDWGVRFIVDAVVPDDVSHIGVRAHYFRPATEKDGNSIPIRILERMETPFEWDVLVQSAGLNHEPIWWQYAKGDMPPHDPDFLTANAGDILLLSDK